MCRRRGSHASSPPARPAPRAVRGAGALTTHQFFEFSPDVTMVVGDARPTQRLARPARTWAGGVRIAREVGVERTRAVSLGAAAAGRRAMSQRAVTSESAARGHHRPVSRVVRGAIARGRRRDDGGEQTLRRPRHSRRRSARVDVRSRVSASAVRRRGEAQTIVERRRVPRRRGSGAGETISSSAACFPSSRKVGSIVQRRRRTAPLPPSPPACAQSHDDHADEGFGCRTG